MHLREHLEVQKEGDKGFTLIQSIVAFANTNGGTILIGVDDDASIVGTDAKSDEDKIKEWIDRQCDPPINVSFETMKIDGKEILVIHVPKGNDTPSVPLKASVLKECQVKDISPFQAL